MGWDARRWRPVMFGALGWKRERFRRRPLLVAMNRDGLLPGVADPKELNVGHRGGSHWLPAQPDRAYFVLLI
jgi:hypothetical protein